MQTFDLGPSKRLAGVDNSVVATDAETYAAVSFLPGYIETFYEIKVSGVRVCSYCKKSDHVIFTGQRGSGILRLNHIEQTATWDEEVSEPFRLWVDKTKEKIHSLLVLISRFCNENQALPYLTYRKGKDKKKEKFQLYVDYPKDAEGKPLMEFSKALKSYHLPILGV